MEAAAVSAAVSATLKLVGNKLAPLVIKEYSSIVGVEKDLRELQYLAQEINSRLEGDRGLYMGDAPSLRKLKEAVSEVEDAVDEFQLKAEKYKADGDGDFVSKYLHTKPNSFVFQCQAAKKIKKIKKMFDDLVKQRSILNSVLGNDPVSHIKDTATNMQTLPFVDEAAVIGRDQEMNDIISELLQDDDQQGIKIVSIVGLGGSGKTTLAQLVFSKVENTNCNHFPVKVWVHVSQEEFQLEKILKKLFDAISNERSDGLSLRYMANKISDELTNKRFLLVLDDVWTQDRIKWAEFMIHLKNGSPGSRILLTTRDRNVAEAVESTALIDLKLLSEDDSWKVFQKSYGNDVEHDLEEVGKEIVNKCGGVPLAIKVLAGVLRVKKRLEQWHAIKESNLLNVDGKEHQVSACLWLSYFNLPSHLKQCFTICSIFPKGHLIDKDQLIDQWIAHDMVVEDGVNYLEYVGDDYFSHLVQMYFIQDVKEAANGRVKCKMHDLVHDLARSILGDEISLVVPKKATNFTKICKYFSVMEHTRHLSPKNAFKKARAMYITKDDDFIFGKASKKAKHLRCITVEYVHASALTAILQTKNLRYLHISGLKCETLPDVISEIWSLQALHVTASDLVNLPDSIGKLQNLRVVNFSYCQWLRLLPHSIGNCVMISSIDLFYCGEVAALPSSISRNKRLRVLRLGHTKFETLPSCITTLENLECLDLRCCYRLVELPTGIGNLKKLLVLNLQGCEKLQGIPKGIAQLTRLEKLGLFVLGDNDEKHAQISELENVNKISGELTIQCRAMLRYIFYLQGMDPDIAHKEWLKKKTNLQSLTIICASGMEKQLDGLEPPPGIKNLKIVGYSGQEDESMQYQDDMAPPGLKTARWMLKHRGAEVAGLPRFRLLSELELSDFPKLERLEGLTELPCLEKLVLKKMTALRSISGGPFPSLLELFIYGMPSLGMVWMVAEVSLADVEEGQVQIGNRLSVLTISECPKLMVMPYFPSSLKVLRLVKSNVQLLGQPGLSKGPSLPSFTACSLGLFSQISEQFNSIFLSQKISEISQTSQVLAKPARFNFLKELLLDDMAPPAGAASHGSGCQWELLQHLTTLESLEIQKCNGLTELPESMRSLASLRTLRIEGCRTLRMLPEWLGELRYLEMMFISMCLSLSPASSMQPLRALKELIIHASGWVGDIGSPSLKTLVINDCDSIHSLPQSFRQLTSLTNLRIIKCHDFHSLSECLGELCSLQMLSIKLLPNLSSLPQSLGHLTSLQELKVTDCEALGQLPDCIGELCSLRVFTIWELRRLTCLPQSLGRLTSLQELQIGSCKALGQLPESLGELCSLRKFEMWGLPGLTCVPKSMCCLTSLEELTIASCPGIRSLAEWIKGLTALQILDISGCPNLEKRCKKKKGKDWHLISHIPDLTMGQADAKVLGLALK